MTGKIYISKELQTLKIKIEEAVSFGLAVNELVTNAYKHAFNGRGEGIIKILLSTNGSQKY